MIKKSQLEIRLYNSVSYDEYIIILDLFGITTRVEMDPYEARVLYDWDNLKNYLIRRTLDLNGM